MGDGEHGALRELLANHFLDEGVRGGVDVGRGFVHENNLRATSRRGKVVVRAECVEGEVVSRGVYRRSARPMQMSCRVPALKFSPLSVTACISLSGKLCTISESRTLESIACNNESCGVS